MMFILVNLDVFDAFPSFNICYDGLKTLEEIFDWFKNKDNPDKSNDSLDQKGIFFYSYQTRTDFCLLIIGLAELDIDKIHSLSNNIWYFLTGILSPRALELKLHQQLCVFFHM